MVASHPHGGIRAGQRARRLAVLIAVMTALLASAWMVAGPTSNAQAGMGQFCWGAGVGGWGQCTASWGQNLTGVFGKGGQHSACVNAYYSGSLIHEWVCSPTNVWALIGFNGARWMQGTVRNNVAESNVLYGEMWY